MVACKVSYTYRCVVVATSMDVDSVHRVVATSPDADSVH